MKRNTIERYTRWNDSVCVNNGMSEALKPNLPHIRVRVWAKPSGKRFPNLEAALRERIRLSVEKPYIR